MKKLGLTLISLLFTAIAFAGEGTEKHNYRCIADMLQAYNCDLYYDLSPEEIDVYLETERREAGKVRAVAQICDAKISE